MVFSADDLVLIKVLRQQKWYGANSPDLNPVDYQIWGSCRSVCITAGFITLTSWSHAWSKSGNISTRCLSITW